MEEGIRLAKQERAYLEHTRFWPITSILNLIVFYGVALGIWGLALRISFFWGALAGVFAGLLIAFTFCLVPIINKQRSSEELEDQTFFVGIFVKFAIIIGIIGLVFLIIKSLFFH